ncbi:MAG: SDR family oxidoreductase [Candidatus Goldbacteria bacterium]|nr:SDR family oxidoreductase [Candidatus Goldiibacteriota bacterium]
MGAILVTGASGNTGAELVKLLEKSGSEFFVAARNTGAPRARRFDFMDPSTYTGAFAGIDKVFLMRPPAISNVKKYIFPAIDAAVDAGVRHFVFLSLQGAEKNTFVPHNKIEAYLKLKKISWTFIRPSFFMQNLTTAHLAEIRDKSEIYVPAGNGRTNFVDVRDVALASYIALAEPGHEGKAYEITGSEALTYYEIAGLLTSALGRKITYKKPGPLSFFIRKISEKQPLTYALVTTALYSVSALGLAGGTSGDFERLSGKKPVTMAEFINDFRGVW